MSLPADGVNANALTETTTIPTGKKLIFLDPDTNEGGIITLENLTKQILSNLATQTFNLDQGTKTLLAALNELNSKAQIVCVTGTTNDVGIVTVYGKFAVSKAYCLSNVASQLTTPYRITVDSISSTNLRLRIRDIATNKALANADLPKFDVLIVGK